MAGWFSLGSRGKSPAVGQSRRSNNFIDLWMPLNIDRHPHEIRKISRADSFHNPGSVVVDRFRT